MTGASFTFTVNRAGVDRLLHSPDGEMGRYLTRILNESANIARTLANVDTGLMRSQIEFTLDLEGGVLVGYLAARTNYSLYVHEGNGSYGGNPFLRDAIQQVIG